MTDLSSPPAPSGPSDRPSAAATLVARRNVWGRLYHGETSIDFYGRRKIGLIVSALLIVVTVVSLVAQGLNLGIDFKGGVAWEVPATTSITYDDIRQILDDNGIEGQSAKLRTLSPVGGTESRINVQVADQSPETVQIVHGLRGGGDVFSFSRHQRFQSDAYTHSAVIRSCRVNVLGVRPSG